MYQSLWQSCLQVLEQELSQQLFNMWIRPLQLHCDKDQITLYAPNRFVLDWVRDKYMNRINELLIQFSGDQPVPSLNFDVGSKVATQTQSVSHAAATSNAAPQSNSNNNYTANSILQINLRQCRHSNRMLT